MSPLCRKLFAASSLHKRHASFPKRAACSDPGTVAALSLLATVISPLCHSHLTLQVRWARPQTSNSHDSSNSCRPISARHSHLTLVSQPSHPLCRSLFAASSLHHAQASLHNRTMFQSQMMLPSQWSHHNSSNSPRARHRHATLVSQPCHPYVAAFLQSWHCISDKYRSTSEQCCKAKQILQVLGRAQQSQ